MLYSVRVHEQVDCNKALRCCALVCRAWRIRSQRRLFNDVLLDGTSALQQFATVLKNGPHLCDYVYHVTLSGRALHTTANPLSLFPIILQGKLQNLKTLGIRAIGEKEDWTYPPGLKSLAGKPLQYIPLHPRFLFSLATFTSIIRLKLFSTTFQRFEDLTRIVYALPHLKTLELDDVKFLILGPLPPYMVSRTEEGRMIPPPQFAPHLQELRIVSTSK